MSSESEKLEDLDERVRAMERKDLARRVYLVEDAVRVLNHFTGEMREFRGETRSSMDRLDEGIRRNTKLSWAVFGTMTAAVVYLILNSALTIP